MAIYYKFRSTNFYESLKINDYAIMVDDLKKQIYESKKLWWKDQLIVVNAMTQEELDDTTLIPKCTSLVISRLCRQPKNRLPIVVQREKQKVAENDIKLESSSSVTKSSEEEINFDDFGDDLFATPQVKSNCMVQDASGVKVNGTPDPSLLDQKLKCQNYFSAGKDFRGENGFEPKKPPQGYICYRCNVPGHFIQHCPTNGDPSYDIKRERQTTDTLRQSTTTSNGLDASSNGLDASPSVVYVSEPNKKFPLELQCPLCKEVMKDAVMTTRCCFKSFCDACIRNHILSKSSCVCRTTNILVDDLVPNKTIRDTISRMRESNGSSSQNAGSVVDAHESLHTDYLKDAIRTLSSTCKSELIPEAPNTYIYNSKKISNHSDIVSSPTEQSSEIDRSTKDSKISNLAFQTLPEEAKLQDNDMQTEVQGQAKLPISWTAAEQGKAPEHFPAENFTRPTYPNLNNPYIVPFYTEAMPYMVHAPGPFSYPLETVFPQDHVRGQGYFTPTFPQNSSVNNSSTKSQSKTKSLETYATVARESERTRGEEDRDGNKRKRRAARERTREEEDRDGNKRNRRAYDHDQQVSSYYRSSTGKERKTRKVEQVSIDEDRERHSKKQHTRSMDGKRHEKQMKDESFAYRQRR